MRIGILGGSFDPPHRGHLRLARAAQSALELDEVIFLPAARNPLKPSRTTASADDRLEMVKLLIHGESAFSVSDMELTRGGMSYTVDTLGELHMVRPAEYWFIMGADGLATLENWKNPNRLAKLCRLAIALRPPMTESQLLVRIPELFKDRFDLVRMAPTEISATEVRDRASRNLSLGGYVSPAVAAYIQKHKLYT
ncbi:nicotinate (nicotinamide) nucleotide adenylyltransferase [bacterium]|nr:MAG: nicotinate (nicotinamide) nucleotide adenylyltransferase [bacterium]